MAPGAMLTMREAIIEKLHTHLSSPPSSEAAVVYAFVQIRKLMEKSNAAGMYPRLKFFCDWVVHGGLAGTGAQQVLIEIDDRLKFYDSRKPWEIDPDGRVGAFLSHAALCTEMDRYLETAGVIQVWTKDPAVWHQVSKLYSEIVRDCPLETERKNYQYPHISKLEITDCMPSKPVAEANAGLDHIGWNWAFTLSDGRTFEMRHSSGLSVG
jgi:hypothetical protein